MFSFVGRRSVKSVNTIANRTFSGHNVDEVRAEVGKWYKMTIVMVGLSVAMSAYNVMVHEHPHGRTGLPYQKNRAKPFPWECSDCTLFDGDCWKECRAAKA